MEAESGIVQKKIKKLQDLLSMEIGEEYCERILDIFSFITHRWTTSILLALEEKPLRNSELQKEIQGISAKMLNETLKRLMDNKMVNRTVFAQVPQKSNMNLHRLEELYWNLPLPYFSGH